MDPKVQLGGRRLVRADHRQGRGHDQEHCHLSPIATFACAARPWWCFMTGPRENVKIFGLRPVEAVAGLVPGGRHCTPIMAALPGLGIETDLVGGLPGADGLRILDPEPHGIGQRVLKFFESWGYQTEIIKLYDEGLRKGESLIVVPASYRDRVAISHLMAGNGGHAVFYFGVGHVESLTGP